MSGDFMPVTGARCNGCIDLVQDRDAAFLKSFSFFSHGNAACGSIEKRRPESFFESSDLLAYAGDRYSHLPGHFGEVFRIGYSDEDPQ
ncbi:hypothetical protein Q0601_22495 [Paracoccus onubensis]|nr:hypothetical protein [Paracoccus onubensis]MDP0929958.1 hypothetical protein [Paracoccus onubensis]